MSIPDWNPEWSETAWDAGLIRRFEETCFDLIITGPLPACENLALDAALLRSVADGRRGPAVWFWDWSEAAVVLGSYQSVQNECDTAFAQERGFTFARRISGGGAMVVQPGKTITYSIVVPEAFVAGLSFVQSFAFLDHWCVRALRALGIPAGYRPINDIVSQAGKIGGAAQCRRSNTVLHHTAMGYELNNDVMRRLLRHGLPKPGDRGIASAEKTVSPLRMFTGLDHGSLRAALVDAFVTLFPTKEAAFTPDELPFAREKQRELSAREWLYRVE